MKHAIISLLAFLFITGCASNSGGTARVTQFGYIEEIVQKNEAYFAVIDYAQWFTGEEANMAGFADGYCSQVEHCAPNGFYIRNKTSDDRQTVEISDKVVIKMQTLSSDGAPTEEFQTLTFEEFYSHYQSKQPVDLRLTPFHFEVEKGKIVEIKEQYLP